MVYLEKTDATITLSAWVWCMVCRSRLYYDGRNHG